MQGLMYKACLILLILVYVFLFFNLTVMRYHSFFSYEWEDLMEVNRVYWNTSQGKLFNLLHTVIFTKAGNRVQPIFFGFFVSVLYMFYPHISTLFFTVTLSLALSAIPIYLIAFEVLRSRWTAFLLATAYLLYAPKHSLNFLDGDTIIFVIPFLLFLFYFTIKGRIKLLVICAVLVILCKTESALFISTYAIYLYVKRQQFKISPKICYLLFIVSVSSFIFNLFIYKKYSTGPLFISFFMPTLQDTLKYIIKHPLVFLSNAHKKAIYQLFAPVLFLPLFSTATYVGLPSLLLIILTRYFVFQRAHYISGLVPFIFIGVIFSIRNISNIITNMLRRFAKNKSALNAQRLYATLGFLTLISCGLSNFGDNIIGSSYPEECGEIRDTRFISAKNIFDKRFYIMDKEDLIAWDMLKKIPPHASVSASGDLLPQLSSREKFLEFLDDDHDYYDVDFILLHNKAMYMGAGHYNWDDSRMKKEIKLLLKSKDWITIAHRGRFILFKRNTGLNRASK